MKFQNRNQTDPSRYVLSETVRNLIQTGAFEECFTLIVEAMKQSPHSPIPHNLLGMLLERKGNHLLAMKHFRVARNLDPTYLPARHNLSIFGTFMARGSGAFDERDCPELEEKRTVHVEYDKKRIGHIVRRGV